MTDPDSQREFDSLLLEVSEGSLTPGNRQRLAELLGSSRDLQRQYSEYCQMHALLRFEHGALVGSDVVEFTPGGRRTATTKARLPWLLAAAAAALLTLTMLQPASRAPAGTRPERGAPVATLTTAVGVRFAYGAHGEPTNPPGTPMPQGVYQLQKGIIELGYDSGALLTIEAPAEFELIDKRAIRLDSGRVATYAPNAAHGFRVDTAAATVVDLGTEFAVEASADKPAEVHVFQGEVRVELRQGKGASATPLRLLTGQATKIDRHTGLPAGIDLDKERFLRRLDSQPQSYSRQVMAMHPAVYYRMEPTGDGDALKDDAGHADAAIHLGRADRPAWAPGKIGTAFELGGPAQQTFAAAAEYPQADGKQISVVAWVYARSRPRWASIAKNWAGADDHGQFHFGLHEDSGSLEAHIANRAGTEIIAKDSVALPLNEWHHVAFVADGDMLRLYRAGEQVAAVPYDDLSRNPRILALAIGTKLNLAGTAPEERDFNMWDGRLDELAIFNYAVSAAEIRRLFELGGMGNASREPSDAVADRRF